MDKIICSKCGSEYSIRKIHYPVRDTDTVDCVVCDEVLKSWRKSTTAYTAKLEVRRVNHLKPPK